MKKTIRLTESDLKRIVKRVIKEDNEEDKMDGMGISITLKDIFKEVKESLDNLGGYDESMRDEIMDLSKEILGNLKYSLSEMLANYISENYEEYLYEILGDGAY